MHNASQLKNKNVEVMVKNLAKSFDDAESGIVVKEIDDILGSCYFAFFIRFEVV